MYLKYFLNGERLIVKEALINDGWTITHDPYVVETQDTDFEADLGAEKLISAERGNEKIAVEVKSFIAASFVYEFHRILGQFLNYSLNMEDFEMEEKIKKYQQIILDFLEEQASFRKKVSDSTIQLIADKENHHYQLLRLGWRNGKFVHLCLFHFDIINGKIWLQENRTDVEIGEYLQSRGIPKSEIVLGFIEPEMRKYADYALA